MRERFCELASSYKEELASNVVPFWETHSVDRECGGYFTCLDRDGTVYDTDKFVWLQARQVWMFSVLYNRLAKDSRWLEIARSGAEFLASHGRNDHGDWYFALDRQGRPLVQPYSIFSDCFAAMAFSQYAIVSGDEKARKIALDTYANVWRRKDNPKGVYSKTVAETRPMKSLAIPMILANLAVEMAWLLDEKDLDRQLDQCVSEITGLFLDRESGLIYEHVSPDGSHPDGFDGRLINPGHGIEAMWFLMDIARRRGKDELTTLAVDIVLRILDFSWDPQLDGIFYFMDSHGKPPQQLEWDRKLWWVHLETIVALAYGYLSTRRAECWEWFERVHEYTWHHFPDPEFGEWYGYLSRAGSPFLTLKGGKWKGFYHLPRALLVCTEIFTELCVP